MSELEVFADVSCPFAHVGLRRFVDRRDAAGRRRPLLHVRAWPLELVNGEPLQGPVVAPKVAALRASVAPELFAGFDPDRFPASTLPALATEAAAYRTGASIGERFSLAVREALFERGADVGDADVLRRLRATHGVAEPGDEDVAVVLADLEDGRRRGVIGSPHFFTAGGDLFCPSLRIAHRGDDLELTFDVDGFDRLVAAALG